MLDSRFSDEAFDDIRETLASGYNLHGMKAMQRYSLLIDKAVVHLREDLQRVGIKKWKGEVYRYHLRFSKKEVALEGEIVQNPSHYIYFQLEGNVVHILRVLHEHSDFRRHI